jgi:hypothetical protein
MESYKIGGFMDENNLSIIEELKVPLQIGDVFASSGFREFKETHKAKHFKRCFAGS